MLGFSQLKSWHSNGFIIIKNVLDNHAVKEALLAVDKVIAAHEQKQTTAKNTSTYHGKKYYNIHDPLDFTDKLDYLLDYKPMFDIVLQLMGPYIEVMGLHLFIRHPDDAKSSNIGRFHTDSGPSLQQQLPRQDNPALQLKVQYFLTDIGAENMSNFIAIPGSHLRRVQERNLYCLLPECNAYLDRGLLPPGATQLKVSAGDVLIHSLTLWHAVAPNLSSNTRRSLSVRYGQMWFKNLHFNISDQIMGRLTPRQRRLLGDYGDAHDGDVAYRPPQDHLNLILEN